MFTLTPKFMGELLGFTIMALWEWSCQGISSPPGGRKWSTLEKMWLESMGALLPTLKFGRRADISKALPIPSSIAKVAEKDFAPTTWLRIWRLREVVGLVRN